MGFLDNRYASVDKQLMEDGAEVDFGQGLFVRVRHASSEKVTFETNKITKKLQVLSRNRELTPEQNKQINTHVAAYAGVVGWRGVGIEVPEFSPQTAMQVFDEKPEFLEDVITVMRSYETFRKELVTDAVGN